VDLRQAAALCAHPKGFVDAGFEIWIRIPTMRCPLDAFGADYFYGRAEHSARRGARDRALFDVMTQAAPCSHCGFIFFLFVGNVYDGFDDRPKLAFGDFVGEGMDDDAAVPEDGFVELRVVCSPAAESGKVPDEQPLGFIR